MGDPGKAVFLSYASQDAKVARILAEALRAASVEVWFDQDELVGGDAWDVKIRRQIAECALFVPVISANTQARHEGYFRLEWRLADQRTHLMGKSRSFLLPICIDDTRDREADVPDSFLAVQWCIRSGNTNAGGRKDSPTRQTMVRWQREIELAELYTYVRRPWRCSKLCCGRPAGSPCRC